MRVKYFHLTPKIEFRGARARSRGPFPFFVLPLNPLQAGLTIFELLIVLGIVSMVMAMSWPALEQMFLGRRLSDAGTLLSQFTARSAKAITQRCDDLSGRLFPWLQQSLPNRSWG